jgi:hypothetical protein
LSRRLAILVTGCLLAVLSQPLIAQGAAPTPASSEPPALVPATAEQAIAQEQQSYGPPAPRKRTCGLPDASGDIIVCAPDNEEFRVQSSRDLNPDSHEALYDGVPRAPQFDNGYCAECAHFGHVPPPVYYIDVAALPAAPPGSEADEVARGERPER